MYLSYIYFVVENKFLLIAISSSKRKINTTISEVFVSKIITKMQSKCLGEDEAIQTQGLWVQGYDY